MMPSDYNFKATKCHKNCQTMLQKISYQHEKTEINVFRAETFLDDSQFSLY